MAVKLRLKRMGRKHRPFYRLNAIEDRAARDGKPIEELGWFNPVEPDETKKMSINLERATYWLDHGAIPSETVSTLLKKSGVEHKMLRLPKPGKKPEPEAKPEDAAEAPAEGGEAKAEETVQA